MKVRTKIVDVLSVKSIPQELAFFEKSFSRLFDNMYFNQYNIVNSNDNKTVEYSLFILTDEVIAITIPGTDLRLLVNYESDGSGFWFNLSVNIGVHAFIDNFKSSTLSDSLDDFYNIFSKILDVDSVYLLMQCVQKYEAGTNKIEDGFISISAFCSLDLAFDSNLSEYENYQLLSKEIFDYSSETIWAIIFYLYVENVNLTLLDKKDRVAFIVGKCFSNEYEFEYNDLINYLYSQIIPSLTISTDIVLGIELSRKVLLPVKINGEVENDESKRIVLKLAEGIINFSTDKGLDVQNEVSVSFPEEYPTAKILSTEFGLGFSEAKLLKEESQNGKMGLFATNALITFPAKWNHNPEDAGNTAQIKARNLLIGTGGISGTLSLEAIDPEAETAALLKLRLGENFNISLDAFALTFRQNEILNSQISGKLTFPGFKQKDEEGNYTEDPVELDIEVFIGNNGDFKISALPVEDLSFYIEKVAKISVYSLAVGEENDKFYADISGEIDFSELMGNLPNITTDMPTNVPIRKLRVWEDGKIEFDGGTITLPRSVTVTVGLSKLVVNSLLFSSTELYHDGKKRAYNVIGFDGDLSINPGVVNMKGDGIKIYYTTDNVSDPDPEINRPAHIFIRLESLELDIVVPAGSTKEAAQFFLHGELSIKNKDGEGASELQHYSGSVDFAVKAAKISGSAAIEYTPQIPRWFIDAQVDISSGLKLGTTGLSVYGFKGLAGKGKRFVKDEEETWWKFYKKPTTGINQSKFQNQDGFALGLGVSLASEIQEGKPFSSIVTLILGLPDVVMLNGRAALMQKRVGFNDQQDPPFSVLLSIDSQSIQAGIGVNTKFGQFVEVNGAAEMAYFWKDAKAWYINVGKDLPESDRIKANIDNLFDAYAYLMLSASGVKFGAGAKWEQTGNVGKAFGYGFKAYLDLYARFNFKPSHMGGGIAMGGEAFVNVSKFKLAFLLDAYLQAETYKPKQIKGGLDVKLELPKPLKSKGLHLEFNWIYETERDTDPLHILPTETGDAQAIQAINMLTGEVFSMGNLNASYASMDDYPVIPADSFVDVTFMNSPRLNITVSDSIVIGGEVTAVNHSQLIPPQKGISEQVRHTFEINGVKIEAHNGSSWQAYNIFEASDTIKAIPEIVTALGSNANYLKTLPQAFWQLSTAGSNTTLRVMANNMFSYLNQNLKGSIEIERLGYEGGVVFCEQSKIQEKEINWENVSVGDTYDANQYHNKDGVRFMVYAKDGAVQELDLYSLNNGLEFSETDGIELVFSEPQGVVKPKLNVPSGNYLHVEYIGKTVDGVDHNNFPIEKFVSLRTDKLSASQVAAYAGYTDDDAPVFKVRITYYKTDMLNSDHDAVLRIGYSTVPDAYYNRCNGLVMIDDVMLLGKAFEAADVNDVYANGYSGGNIIAHWELNGNGNDASGNAYNGTATNSPIASPGRNNSTSNAYHVGRCGLYSSSTARYFEVSHSSALSVGKENFSIMAWIKIPANASQQILFKDNWYIGQKTIVSKMDKTDGGYQFYTETYKESGSQKLKTNLCFEYKKDSSLGQYIPKFAAECNDLIDGEWHHVAVVKTFGYEATLGIETNVIDLYVDGVWLERKAVDIPVSGTSDKAAIVKLNYLDVNSHLFNLSMPAQSVLNSMNNKMKDGLTKTVQPIWRPDTKYRIQITGNEIIDGANNSSTYTVNFQTKGATGYFEKEGVEIDDDKFKLGRIQGYIDYERSHPNAAGNVLDSKPLYYEGAVLNLFYKAPYMNLMFDQWSTYQGIAATEYNLKVQVMDSRTAENVSAELEPEWTYKDETLESEDIKTINNLLENGPNCWGDAGGLKRKTATAAFVLPNLLPANLYTTTYFSVNKNADPDTEVEVHKHVFQTSRFANFVEHISSFRYSRPETVQAVQIAEDFNGGTGSFSASSGSSLSMSQMVLVESSHNPGAHFTFPTIFGVPYELVSGLKGYSYNFGGKSEFYCKVDKYPLYNGNLMSLDREPQELVYRWYSEKTGDTNVEFGLKNNKIGMLQHFVLDSMKVRVPVFNEVLTNKLFTDGSLDNFIALSGSTIGNTGNSLHVENINAPKLGFNFDTLEGVTYTITFDVLAASANGGGSQDLFASIGGGMLSQLLNVTGSFPQTLTCSFTANSSGTKLLEIYFDSATTLGTTESFEIDNFKIEHSVTTAFDLIGTDFSSGPGGLAANIVSHYEPQGVLYVESDSTVPTVELPLTLEANAKYNLKFKVPAQSYNEGELKMRVQAGSLFDEDLEAGTGAELSFDFETTTAETVDIKISLKDASSSELEYFMLDDFSLTYTKTEDVVVESLFDRTIALDSGNVDAFKAILNDSDEQDADWLSALPLKYDRLIAAPLGSFQACERLEIQKFINQSDDDALLGLIIRSPEPLFLPNLEGSDLDNSLSVTCELPEGAGTVSEFKLVYSKDRTSVFVTNSDMDIPYGEYHFDFKYLSYNGVSYAVKQTLTDEVELVVNVI